MSNIVLSSRELESRGISPGEADCTEALLRLLDEMRNQKGLSLEFGRGRYHFSADKSRPLELSISNHTIRTRRIIFDLSRMDGFSLRGEDTEFIFSGHCLPFALIECRNIRISGILMDYRDPHCLQGEVVSRGLFSYTLQMNGEHSCSGGKGLNLEGPDGSLPINEAVEWNPHEKRRLYRALPSELQRGPAARTGENRFRIRCLRPPRPGNAMVMRAGERTQPGFLIHESRQVLLKDVIIRHAKGIAVLGQMSEDIDLQGVDLSPDSGSSRCFSGHDDAYHFSNCRGRITLEQCRAQGQMDDGLNVHGTYTLFRKRNGDGSLNLIHKHHQSRGFNLYREGDEVLFLRPGSLDEIGRGTVDRAEVREDGNLNLYLAEDPGIQFPPHTVVENRSAAVDLTVRSCCFRNNRARGILFTTSGRVLVEDCDFEPSGAGILIAGDACTWYESGGVRDVLIRNNRFKNCNTEMFQYCKAVISIFPELKDPKKNRSFHRNIRISGNRITTFDAPVLFASSTGHLEFTDNEILRSREYKAYHPNRSLYRIESCEGVVIEGNTLPPDPVSRKVVCRNSKNCRIKV